MLIFCNSKEGKGLLRMCLSGISFPPLSSVIGKEKLQSMIDNQRRRLDEQIKTNSLAPGYREQAKIRLNNFEANISGNCEILFSPAFYGVSELKTANQILLSI